MKIQIDPVDEESNWPYSCKCRASIDDFGLPFQFMADGTEWCDNNNIDVIVHYDMFYFKTLEDQMSFVLRWRTE